MQRNCSSTVSSKPKSRHTKYIIRFAHVVFMFVHVPEVVPREQTHETDEVMLHMLYRHRHESCRAREAGEAGGGNGEGREMRAEVWMENCLPSLPLLKCRLYYCFVACHVLPAVACRQTRPRPRLMLCSFAMSAARSSKSRLQQRWHGVYGHHAIEGMQHRRYQ